VLLSRCCCYCNCPTKPLQTGGRAPRGMCAAQVAALEAADEVDDVAARIGAANTLVRQPDGSLKARSRR
jgi:hypothetical protein